MRRAETALDRLAHVLGDPMRLRILDLLAKGRRAEPCCSPRNPQKPRAVCACDLRPALGDIAPSKLAYHLKELRAAGLVTEERKGKWVYYTLDQTTLERFSARLLRRYLGPRCGPTTCSCNGASRPAPRQH